MSKHFATALLNISSHPSVRIPTRKVARELLIALPLDCSDQALAERLAELDRQEAELIASGEIVIDG